MYTEASVVSFEMYRWKVLPISNTTLRFLSHQILLGSAGDVAVCTEARMYCSAISIHSPLLHQRIVKHLKHQPIFGWNEDEDALNKDVPPTVYDLNSKLHPRISQIAKDLIDAEISVDLYKMVRQWNWTYEMSFKMATLIADRFRKKLRLSEEKLLYQEMSKCRKTALILEEDRSLKLAQKLRKEGLKYVSTGEENLANISLGFALKGVINPRIIRRLQSVDVAGLWNWWQKFIEGQNKISQFNRQRIAEYEKPTIAGNIIVIFSLLFLGLAAACLGFTLEVHGLIILMFGQHCCTQLTFARYRSFLKCSCNFLVCRVRRASISNAQKPFPKPFVINVQTKQRRQKHTVF